MRDERPLAELIAAAEAAGPHDRIHYRDPIASYGIEGIVAVSPWVADRILGAFAVRVIETVAKAGDATDAIRALRSLRSDAATGSIQRDIDDVLVRLDEKPQKVAKPIGSPPPPPPPRGPRRFVRSWTFWHLIGGVVSDPVAGNRYLTLCHRWNSEAFASREGPGVLDELPTGTPVCFLCENAEASTSSPPRTTWKREMATWRGEPRLHARMESTWHLATDDDAVPATEVGAVLLTHCGWWVESHRLLPATPAFDGPHAPMCETCERAMEGGSQFGRPDPVADGDG